MHVCMHSGTCLANWISYITEHMPNLTFSAMRAATTQCSADCCAAAATTRRFALWILAGTWHSLPVYFLPWYTLVTPDRNGRGQDLSGTGTAVFIALTFAVALKLCTRTHAWSWITHLVYWLSLAVLFPFVYVVSILWPQTAVSGVSDMSGTGAWLFSK